MARQRKIIIEEKKRITERMYGKALVSLGYKNPRTQKFEEYIVFDYENQSKGSPVIIFPLTSKKEVVAVRQFRFGAGEEVLELPGGNPHAGEQSLQTARKELSEETGYKAQSFVKLSCEALWFEPSTYTVSYDIFLAKNCKKVSEPALDNNEFVSVKLIPLKRWIAYIKKGIVRDSKSIVATYLALDRIS